MELISISQSLIKKFYAFNDADYCGLKVYYEFWEGHQRPSTDTFDKGRLFEFLLIGATRDGTRPEMRRHATTGAKLKMETDVEDMAAWAIGKMDEMGFKIVEGTPQLRYEAEYKGIKVHGHFDAYAMYHNREVCLDVKYTETAHDDFRNGWGLPEEKDHLQAIHYTWLQHIKEGNARAFHYAVFGLSKDTKWAKNLKIRVSEQTINQHGALITKLAKDIKAWTPQPTKSMAVCAECPFRGFCAKAVTVPNEEVIEI